MGRKNKKYKKDLKTQIHDRLVQMLRAGEGRSRHNDKHDNNDKDKIYSYNSYHTYWKRCKLFAAYVRNKHPECTTLKSARKYVPEFLQARVEHGGTRGQPLSAYTITLERQALNKLFGITPDDKDFFVAPTRRRVDIKRSRTETKSFSEYNNLEFVHFCKATGCRRNIVCKLKGADLVSRDALQSEFEKMNKKSNLNRYESKHYMEIKDALDTFPDQDYFLYHRKDKGGKNRYAPVTGKHKNEVIRRMKSTPSNEKVWLNVPTNAPIHSYRSSYANEIYRLYARPLESIPIDKTNKGIKRKYQSGVYCCRKDMAGVRYDRAAMLKVSKSLGHNRISVCASHYLRNL